MSDQPLDDRESMDFDETDPESILAAHEAGRIDRRVMLRRLARIHFTVGEGDPHSDWGEGHRDPVWRIVENALVQGRLADSEYEWLAHEVAGSSLGEVPDVAYDDLPEPAQAAVRACWENGITERRGALDLANEFRARGESWTEADERGNPVTRGPSDDRR